YDEADLRLLRQIRTLRDFGFELEETRPFVWCPRAGHPAGDACPAPIAVHRRKPDELDGLIEQLRTVRAQVGAQLLRAEAELPHGPEPRCALGTHPGGAEETDETGVTA
ncbi:MerR family DNA-binding protein, partial [Streptomyces sp.]|uniref:MerR family DNA-binding protein n=1 Tax=Streptomyces sp. TaxID=1931 RepID=UPI002811BAD6